MATAQFIVLLVILDQDFYRTCDADNFLMNLRLLSSLMLFATWTQLSDEPYMEAFILLFLDEG